MNYIQKSIVNSITLILVLVLTSLFFTTSAFAQKEQRKSSELLIQIIDIQIELAVNEQFQSQAKMLGEYLESARSADESQKIEIYTRVLDILTKIKITTVTSSVQPDKGIQSVSAEKTEKQDKIIYEPGAALLEIFKAESLDNIPDLPVIRTLWKRDLTCWGDRQDRENPWRINKSYFGAFLIPERAFELGAKPGYEFSAPYVAQFSFYYEAKESGKYSFTIMHSNNICELKIGDISVVNAQIGQPAAQGICKLEKGFHRVEFYLMSNIYDSGSWMAGADSYFTVKVLSPNAFDAVPITKDMLLMKPAKIPSSQSYGWLGITIQDLIVVKVFKDSPAERAGIRKGDLILSFADNRVRGDQELVNLVTSIEIGKKVPIKVLREEKVLNLTIEVSKRLEEIEN